VGGAFSATIGAPAWKDRLDEGRLDEPGYSLEAFAAKIIEKGQTWIEMLDHRNLLSHSYDASTFEKTVEAIAARYLPAMQELHDYLAMRK
jgi:hypothetical protein